MTYLRGAIELISALNSIRTALMDVAEDPPAESMELFLAEYRELQAQLRLRIVLQNVVFGLHVLVLAGISTFALAYGLLFGDGVQRLGEPLLLVLLAVPLASSLLGLLWLHNRVGAFRIARYLAQHLVPTLQKAAGTTELMSHDSQVRKTLGDTDYHAVLLLVHLLPSAGILMLTAGPAFTLRAAPGSISWPFVLPLWLLGLLFSLLLLNRYIWVLLQKDSP